jgi:hypothetical protein
MAPKYGDISPRTAAYVVRELLEQGKDAMTFGNFKRAVDTNDYDDDVLMICPDGSDSCANCVGCACLDPHYSYECMCEGPGPGSCPDCMPIDEEQRKENEIVCKDLHVDIWGKSILELMGSNANLSGMFKKFSDIKPMPRPGGMIKFRRFSTFKANQPGEHIHDALSYATHSETFSNNFKNNFSQSETEVENENSITGDPSNDTEKNEKEKVDAPDTDWEADDLA